MIRGSRPKGKFLNRKKGEEEQRRTKLFLKKKKEWGKKSQRALKDRQSVLEHSARRGMKQESYWPKTKGMNGSVLEYCVQGGGAWIDEPGRK